jgi:hypothetical protein
VRNVIGNAVRTFATSHAAFNLVRTFASHAAFVVVRHAASLRRHAADVVESARCRVGKVARAIFVVSEMRCFGRNFRLWSVECANHAPDGTSR